jgi:predicted CopG family antitoxin
MRNITVTIPDDVYRRARVWAAERDTSVSAVVKYLLETMPGIKRSNLAFPARNSNPVNTSSPSHTPPTQ